jgi:menaquinone-specific isochorismate synthase
LARRLYCLLENTHKVPVNVYGLWDEREGILGATPEILFQRLSNDLSRLKTFALAGTRFHQSSTPLLEDSKELQEHRWVVEGISHSLEKFGQLTCEKTRELILPQLSHLFTPIEVVLNAHWHDQSPVELFNELVRSLHPTPALGAFPREAGMQWLRSYRTLQDRMRSGAPFGILGQDGSQLCLVSIRNIQWKNSQIFVGAGCGVIAESQLDRESAELLAKIRSIQRIFGWEAS